MISLRKSINNHCKDCGYDPQSQMGNWRQQIGACTVKKCALWPVRPVSSTTIKEVEDDENNA